MEYRSATFLEVAFPLADVTIVWLQMMSFSFHRDFPWGEGADPLRSFLFMFSLDIFEIEEFTAYVVALVFTCVLTLAFAVVLLGNVHGSLHQRIQKLQGGRQSHHAASPQEKRLKSMQRAVRWVSKLCSTVGVVPLVGMLLSMIDCTQQPTTADEPAFYSWDMHDSTHCFEDTHLVFLPPTMLIGAVYLLYTARLATVDGDLRQLPATSQSSVWHRFRLHMWRSSWLEDRPVFGLGALTRDPKTSRKFDLFTLLGKLLPCVVTLLLSTQVLLHAAAFNLVSVILVVATVLVPSYIETSTNSILLTARVVIAWTNLMGVVVVLVKQEDYTIFYLLVWLVVAVMLGTLTWKRIGPAVFARDPHSNPAAGDRLLPFNHVASDGAQLQDVAVAGGAVKLVPGLRNPATMEGNRERTSSNASAASSDTRPYNGRKLSKMKSSIRHPRQALRERAKISSWEAVFTEFDLDGNGQMDLSELQQAMMTLGLKDTSEEELRTMIAEVDTDGDGQLNREEFAKLLS